MTSPVRVVIPTIPSRERFLRESCLPSVLANDPVEISIVRGGGNANVKRNFGLFGCRLPFVLCVDDDTVLHEDCLRKLYAALDSDPDAAFAYCDFKTNAVPGVRTGFDPGFFRCGPFDVGRLRQRNYINTTSLVRYEWLADVGAFDPEILRFQDWDLWLRIVAQGGRGVYVPEVLFDSWHIDEGISATVQEGPARAAIVRKHGL